MKKPAATSEKSKTIQKIFDDDDDSDEDLFDMAKKGTKWLQYDKNVQNFKSVIFLMLMICIYAIPITVIFQ